MAVEVDHRSQNHRFNLDVRVGGLSTSLVGFRGPFCIHPTPYALPHTPYALHPAPYTLNPNPDTRNPKPQTPNPKPEPQNLNPEARSPSPETRNPKAETRNLKVGGVAGAGPAEGSEGGVVEALLPHS